MKGKQIQGTTLWKNNNCKTNQCPPPTPPKNGGVGEEEVYTHTHIYTYTHTQSEFTLIYNKPIQTNNQAVMNQWLSFSVH